MMCRLFINILFINILFINILFINILGAVSFDIFSGTVKQIMYLSTYLVQFLLTFSVEQLSK